MKISRRNLTRMMSKGETECQVFFFLFVLHTFLSLLVRGCNLKRRLSLACSGRFLEILRIVLISELFMKDRKGKSGLIDLKYKKENSTFTELEFLLLIDR